MFLSRRRRNLVITWVDLRELVGTPLFARKLHGVTSSLLLAACMGRRRFVFSSSLSFRFSIAGSIFLIHPWCLVPMESPVVVLSSADVVYRPYSNWDHRVNEHILVQTPAHIYICSTILSLSFSLSLSLALSPSHSLYISLYISLFLSPAIPPLMY